MIPRQAVEGTPPTLKKERLLSIIEYAQQSARMRQSPTAAVAQHQIFAFHEYQAQDLPGVHFNTSRPDDENELWFSVERLRETKSPEADNTWLSPWLAASSNPAEEPKLRESIAGQALIDAGTHRSAETNLFSKQDSGKLSIDPEAGVVFASYEKKEEVRAGFVVYADTRWRPWAEEEKRRRRTIRLYAQLFTLQQQLASGIVEATLELVCGAGIGIWNCEGTVVSYPLITRLVEVSLNPITATIEVRPRDADPRLEVDWYASMDNPGVPSLEKAAKDFFGKATQTFSPFDRGTFEPLLQFAVTHLNANGVYWPHQVPAEERSLPKSDDYLKVTDTWVLFARPRTASAFIADLDRFKAAVEQVDGSNDIPEAVAAVVTDPSAESVDIDLPSYRGVSGGYDSSGRGADPANRKAQDLFFPKPFNDEQVRIVQLLEVSDGVCVQGPPGTGKTHTIANVICHYLANGHRVLVTSMKEPALAEVQNKLPEEIRPLAISLLTTEADGMHQFELAISKIASEVQHINRAVLTREITRLDETIDAIHGRLVRVDGQVGDWAKRNLSRIDLDGEHLDPQDAAREVAASGQYEWFPDALGVEKVYVPQVTDTDIAQLREARRLLGPDIDYLETLIPQLVEFPDSRLLLQAHQDLSRLAVLTREIDAGDVPGLPDSSQETLAAVQRLAATVSELKHLRAEVISSNKSWTARMHERLRLGAAPELINVLETLGNELTDAVSEHKTFLARPVSVPPGLYRDTELVEAIGNLAAGRRPFGLLGLVSRSEAKRKLDAVQVLGAVPRSDADWQHVERFVGLLCRLRNLAVRWNAVAPHLGLDSLAGTEAEHGLAAADGYKLYERLRTLVQIEASVSFSAAKLFPAWSHAARATEGAESLTELETALRQHITKNRLTESWVVKERFQRALQSASGRVCEAIRRFLTEELGNPGVPDPTLQAKWSALMAELSRVHGLSELLAIVRDVCARIATSGATKWSEALKQPLSGITDTKLPDNWRAVWRLRRLATYLDSIDPKEELKRLAGQRRELESDLARAYQDVIVKRTWLKLAENTGPNVRAALMAYLNAIQKIGKGTGKRAVRYRQEARAAAGQANHAVPCWIMSHHRVSESLPSELGSFDLVVIDEASQSDLTALPALLRARKVLIVGDDKQVSPEAIGLEEEKVRSLMGRFLVNQVQTYRPQLSPERSIYDLFKVVFAKSGVMLKEHFRCVGPIIEYSKRQFYGHELKPLRLPKPSERLDPPLIDVLVEDGFRTGDINTAEARFIVEEIKQIVADPAMERRTIGVVSLLGDKQALHIWNRLIEEVGTELMARHRIACGDARNFQGKERHIMFLSMVVAPNEKVAPLSRETFNQRFNVAASRAQDRMYLVRSVEPGHLSEADKLRRSLINHFMSPFAQDEARVEDLRMLCESPFERELYDALIERGYRVTPQVKVGEYRIDLVVEGHNDARLAVECDGDRYHGPDKWADDLVRQRVLERAGWVFWRCFASAYVRRRREVLDDLEKTLAARGVAPIGSEGALRSLHTEHRRFHSPDLSPDSTERGADERTVARAELGS